MTPTGRFPRSQSYSVRHDPTPRNTRQTRWRNGRDSNPRALWASRFQGGCICPLCHRSGPEATDGRSGARPLHCGPSRERCRSGRTGRPAKALTIARWSVGSNPTLSATRLAGPHVGPVTSMLRFDDEGCRPVCFLRPAAERCRSRHRTVHDPTSTTPPPCQRAVSSGTARTTSSSTTARRRCRYDAFDEVDPWVEPDDAGLVGVDPRLVRVGAIAAAAVLMIPVALALREDGGGELRSRPRRRSPRRSQRRRPATAHRPDHGSRGRARRGARRRRDRRTTSRRRPSPRRSPSPSRRRAPAPTPSSSTTSGTASRSRRAPRVEEWLAANDATADTPAVRRRRAVHPGRRHGSGARADDDRGAGDDGAARRPPRHRADARRRRPPAPTPARPGRHDRAGDDPGDRPPGPALEDRRRSRR